jgi:hypothetical protein
MPRLPAVTSVGPTTPAMLPRRRPGVAGGLLRAANRAGFRCRTSRLLSAAKPEQQTGPLRTGTADRAGFRCRTSRLPRAQIQRVGTLRSRTAGAPIRVRGKAPQLSREGAAASRPSAQPPTTTQRSWRLSALRDCLWVVTDAGVDVVGGVGRSSRLN